MRTQSLSSTYVLVHVVVSISWVMSFVCALCNKRLDGNAVRLNKHAGVRKIKTYDLIVISLHQVYNNMKCNEGDINRYTDVLNYQFIFDHKTWLKIVTTQFLKKYWKKWMAFLLKLHVQDSIVILPPLFWTISIELKREVSPI